MKFKIAFFLILVVAILEGVWIYFVSKPENIISLPNYMFSDYPDIEGLVGAQGSWVSTTPLAIPVNTVEIDCWKDWGYCIFGSAYVDNGFLTSNLDIHQIATWTDDVIETKPDKPLMGCVEETYRFDRRSKVVTYVRRTVDNTSEKCKGVQDEPITSTLQDGYKRINAYKNSK